MNELDLNRNNTLIILDWDDTLYPTSWAVSKEIDLTCPDSRYEYLEHFKKLDIKLSKLLSKIKELGMVVIITNAMPDWIKLTLSILPKTKDTLYDIEIISARKRYQKKTNVDKWKIKTFIDLVDEKSKIKMFSNILSLGDSKYEHKALINLFKYDKIPNKYLKSIKFIKSSDYEIILDQIDIINDNIEKICMSKRHLDLDFDLE